MTTFHPFASSGRILILDGALGTMLQGLRLSESDFRGERFRDWPSPLCGNNDLLCLTRPDDVLAVSRAYIEAGADIVTTNTFNANAISLADYGMQDLVGEINRAGASLLRREADRVLAETGRKVYVAGSVGPTNKTASMSPDIADPAMRAVTYDDLYDAYITQIEALMDGGVDLLLFETVFDTLNLKAGLDAAMELMERKGATIPIMLSVTLAGAGGRTLSGQTVEAFLASVSHVPLASIGFNCSFGACDMGPHLRALSRIAPYPVSCYPNAGLPNAMGEYDETPAEMADVLGAYADEGLLNIVGGCCGTTPAHIRAIAERVKCVAPRAVPAPAPGMHLSGLEELVITPETLFVHVGERCNVAGSRKFLRLIREGNAREALSVARAQVEAGARVIDINMDDAMMDARKEMTHFLNLLASEPDIAAVPVMIDSSKWDVIEASLKCVQGKPIVNSISLKEGEERFLEHARRIRRLGAAVVVMAFDEKGQADVYERKVEVCARAYRLLTEKAGFNPEDIIFDPNILAIATGIREHDRYADDFIRATAWIKQNLPDAKVSGGVSNLSFSFRGNNVLRESLHAVFLYHAIAAGLDMAIVNPSTSVTYEDIDPSLRTLLEDVVLYRRPEAAEELAELAPSLLPDKDAPAAAAVTAENRKSVPVAERLTAAVVKGVADYLEEDIDEMLAAGAEPVAVIDGPLMAGINRVGTLFGDGRMFLPQVVKTARTMKRAVEILQPHIEASSKAAAAAKAGKVVFATVKGDVHDIGKNIVSIVLGCNNYEVIDLGVMVPAEQIVSVAMSEKPDFVCLSGLITPSLEEMANVVRLMGEAGLRIPVMVGGATTSAIHTAVKIAPCYSGPVIHVPDAAQNPLIAAQLLNPDTREEYIRQLRLRQQELREAHRVKTLPKVPLEEARRRALRHSLLPYGPVAPRHPGRTTLTIPVSEVADFINWQFFFNAWKLTGSSAAVEESKARLLADAKALLKQLEEHDEGYIRATVVLTDAHADGDDIVAADGRLVIPTLRSQAIENEGHSTALADYLLPEGDYIGLFALRVLLPEDTSGDDYAALLRDSLSHRLAEAASEWLHAKVRRELWGYAPDECLSLKELSQARYQGIRPAVGYPSLPDQRLTHLLDPVLDYASIGITLTENGAMAPAASVSGLYIAHPQARYFTVRGIAPDQAADYARRRGISPQEFDSYINIL